MISPISFLLADIIPMPTSGKKKLKKDKTKEDKAMIERFIKDNEIFPTSEIPNKEDQNNYFDNLKMVPISNEDDVIKIEFKNSYVTSINSFVHDTFSEERIMVKKDALMRKVVVSASEDKSNFPYQVKVNHAIFETLDKMNQVDAEKFELYAIEKGFLMSDEVAYEQDILWNKM